MRILLADDDLNVRLALQALLERQPGLEIVGGVATARELLIRVRATCPDLVLLDWELPGSTAVALLPELDAACPELAVIALSGRPGARRAALAAGADAFVSKVDSPEYLLAALQSIRRARVRECPRPLADGMASTKGESR
jgi:DNA-binding NarL/FixJ family response regulator